MFVKAIKPGFYDTARNGRFMEIKVGTVFEVPDTLKLGAWMVRCDAKGQITDPRVARETANAAKARADKEESEAKLAAARAKTLADAAEREDKRAKQLEAEAHAKPEPESKAK